MKKLLISFAFLLCFGAQAQNLYKTSQKEGSDSKYYPPLPRTRIPLDVSEENFSYSHTSSDGTTTVMPGFVPGTLIYCQPVTNFEKSREPLRLVHPSEATKQTLDQGSRCEIKGINIPHKGRLLKRPS